MITNKLNFLKYFKSNSVPLTFGVFIILAIILIKFYANKNIEYIDDSDIQLLHAPLYDSTVDTNFDIINEGDQNVFLCLKYEGQSARELFDRRNPGVLPIKKVFLFTAYYGDGTQIEVLVNPEFRRGENARKEALIYADKLGTLPSSLRKGVKQLVVHGAGYHGFSSEQGVIFVYSDYAIEQLKRDHLEESLFHEAVHASWDHKYSMSKTWLRAQELDGRFLTKYGQEYSKSFSTLQLDRVEDLAETSLFAYSVLRHPTRLPPTDFENIVRAIPNRISFIDNLLTAHEESVLNTKKEHVCDK